MVEKTSRYYQIGALIAVILASGAGYFMIASDSYDLCVSGGEYGVWNETDVNFRYECSIDHTFNNCWNITNKDVGSSGILITSNLASFFIFSNCL